MTTMSETGDALRVQRILDRYASGEISLSEVSTEVGKVRPEPQKMTRGQKIATFLTAFIILMLTPPWLQVNTRQDGR